MKSHDWLDIVWGLVLIMLAIKYFPIIGVLGALSFALAGVKIGTLPIDRRINA